ncbi:MAG TPA: hypothetical protein VGB76_19040 [Pyrinomonadaceae bacterium]|jgi:hypothetical protein
MKRYASLKLLLALLLCLSPTGSAQTALNCDQLREKIAQLEKMDLKAMSPSIQQIYRESLLKLHTQFGQCLQRDISAMTDMQKAVAGTDAAPDVEDKLRGLQKERAETDAKLALLRTASNLSTPQSTADAPPAPTETASSDEPAREQPDADDAVNTDPASPAGATTPSPVAVQTTGAAITCAPPLTYADPPSILSDIAGKDAADVVRNNDPDRAIRSLSQMILYTLSDAASPASSEMVRTLEAYQFLGETARTDKQLGASAKSDGAVSAIEKPGFARLLGFAIEHGGINKKNDGTNLTLSTSLYSLYTFNRGDTAETYDRAGVLNRVGVAATFNIDNTDDELANARRNNLSEWSVKARLFGDRSTRSASFQKFFDAEIRPLIRARLASLGGATNQLSQRLPVFNQIARAGRRCLPTQVRTRMDAPDYKSATPEAQQKIISDLILGHLKANVLDRVANGTLKLDAPDVAFIEVEFLPGLKTAIGNLLMGRDLLEKRIEDLKKSPLGTLAYTNHRQPLASDYSEAKFLFEQDKSFFRPLKLMGNLGVSFYHSPDRALNQQKLRDISAAISFEGTTASPFTEAENLSKITYSFVGRYERLFENRRMANRKPDLATAQFVMEIPFIRGLSLPFSLTYANATEEERKKNVRFNFGMRLDTDKLFDLLRAPSASR